MPVTGNMQKYIEIVKMHGEPNSQIYFEEAVGWLFYSGMEELSILEGNNNKIATMKNGVICYFQENGEKNCSSNKNSYFQISAQSSYFKRKSNYILYLKIGESTAKRYVFTKVRAKNTETYQAQIIGAAVDACEGLN